jgi:hypothetical protein
MIEVMGDKFSDSVEFVKVMFAVFDVDWQSERSKITYGCFVGETVLDNFGAEVGQFDGADIGYQIIISVASKKMLKI